MLLDDVKTGIIIALKAHDETRVSTLRFLLSAVQNHAIAKYAAQGEAGLTDADILEVVKKQVKTHRESILAFTQGKRPELAEKERKELVILEAFLPAELTDEEILTIIKSVVNPAEKNFGLLMKSAMAAVAGRADGTRVSTILKQILSAK